MENKKILVIYVGVAGINSTDVEFFVKRVAEKITPTTFNGEIIIIPTQTIDTKIECINPKYITDVELIKEHSENMLKLQNELNKQINIISKEIDNEKN